MYTKSIGIALRIVIDFGDRILGEFALQNIAALKQLSSNRDFLYIEDGNYGRR